jgi:hypothetical protein
VKLLADDAEARHRERSPVYCNDNPKFRIVSRPNRKWVVQYNTGGAYATRENDPWLDISP